MKYSNNLPKYTFNWKGVLALVGGLFIPSVILSVVTVFLMLVFHTNYQYSETYMVITNALIWISAIFCFDYFVCRPETGKKLNFNFSSTNFYTYLLIFPMMLGMMFIAETITAQIPISGPFWGKMYDYFSELMNQLTGSIPTMVLLAVIMAPLFEEIVFRGIIQKGLINGGTKPQKAIWISALLFGLVHGNPWQFVGAVLLGFVLGTVYEKTKSLLLPVLLHAFNNLCSTILVALGGTESFADYFHISEWIILGIGIVLFSLFYYLFMKKYRIHYSE